MTYEELLDHYRSKTVFEYGKSIIQIAEMETYIDSDTLKTDFIYHTDRNRRGIISITHEKTSDEMAENWNRKKNQLEKDILDAVTRRVNRFRRETGAAPKQIDIHISEVTSDNAALKDYRIDRCAIDLDTYDLKAKPTKE